MTQLSLRLLYLSLLGVALFLLAGLASVARADGPVDTSYFGIDDGGIVWAYPERLALARGLGARYLRIALHWRRIERVNTTPEGYNWEYSDIIMQDIANGGMIPLVFISENPKWAAKTPCGPIDTTKPGLLAEFAEFMGALAARYPQVKLWTLYNEADHDDVPHHSGGCFGSSTPGGINNNGVPDYADYAEMAAVAHTAVHRANPDAQVSVAVAFDAFSQEACPPDYPGGCSPQTHINYNFLPNLFGYMAAHPRRNGEPYIDRLTFTYYDIYGPFWERQPSGAGWRGIQAKAAAIRKRMSDAGATVPLFVTETGDDSQTSWIGLDGQSKCLTMTFVRGIAAGLQEMTWWTFADNPARGWYYGTVDADFNPKPSYTAYQTVVQELSGWTFKGVVRKQALVEAYKFVRDGKVKVVAWSADTAPAWISPCARDRRVQVLPLRAKRLLVTDMYGNSKLYRDNKGNDLDPRINRMKIRIDGTPRYITRDP